MRGLRHDSDAVVRRLRKKVRRLMITIAVNLSPSDAKWLDRFLQDEYKREGFRPNEKRKPEVCSVGEAVQLAIESYEDATKNLAKCSRCGLPTSVSLEEQKLLASYVGNGAPVVCEDCAVKQASQYSDNVL